MPRPGPLRPSITFRIAPAEYAEALQHVKGIESPSDAYRRIFTAGLEALRPKQEAKR